MYPGGRIIHFVENNSVGNKAFLSTPTFTVAWAKRENFDTILVAARMITQHIPKGIPLVPDMGLASDDVFSHVSVVDTATADSDDDDDDDMTPMLGRQQSGDVRLFHEVVTVEPSSSDA